MKLRSPHSPTRVALLALGTAMSIWSCSKPAQPPGAATCGHTGDLLRTIASAPDYDDEDMSRIVDQLVDAARSSGESALQDPAERLSDAWEASRSDQEAAPTAAFGAAANDLAMACTDRGFTYPEIGFD